MVDVIGSYTSFYDDQESILGIKELLDNDDDLNQNKSFPVRVVNGSSDFPKPELYFELPSQMAHVKCRFEHAKSDLILHTDDRSKSFCYCFDSCATQSAIAYSALKALESLNIRVLRVDKTRTETIQVMDGEITTLGTVHLAFPINGEIYLHNFVVFKDVDIHNCFILGADFHHSKKVQIHYFSERFAKNALKTRKSEYSHALQSTTLTQTYAHECALACAPPTKAGTFCTHACGGAPPIYALTLPDSVHMAVLTEEIQPTPDSMFKRVFDAAEVSEKQRRHSELSQIRYYLHDKSGKVPVPRYAPYLNDLCINDYDVLMYKNSAVVVSVTFAVEFISALHDNRGHPGTVRMQEMIKTMIWRPNIKELVAEVCRACPVCKFCKPNTENPKPPILKSNNTVPFTVVSFDIIKLPKSSSGATCVLVIMDLASRWAQMYPLKTGTGQAIKECFIKYLASIPACPLFNKLCYAIMPRRIVPRSSISSLTTTEFAEFIRRLTSPKPMVWLSE